MVVGYLQASTTRLFVETTQALHFPGSHFLYCTQWHHNREDLVQSIWKFIPHPVSIEELQCFGEPLFGYGSFGEQNKTGQYYWFDYHI